MKILMASTEVNPYSKSGGLGDVIGSLPQALRSKNIDVRVALPLYKTIPQHLLAGAQVVAEYTTNLSWRSHNTRVLQLGHIYFIQNDQYFNRDNYYGYDDDFERFAFFSKATVELAGQVGFEADILHFNDWHTGLGPTYLQGVYKQFSFYSKMKSLFTIHNLNYQGIFGREILWEVGLNDGYYTSGQLEFHGKVSYLKAGLIHADAISTVSKTYAEEIQTPSYGYRMEGILHQRGATERNLYGITNGIDTTEYNPATDPRIINFDADNLDKKRENKHKLQQELGLPISDAPMFAMITRLAEQKGLDILSIIMEELMGLDIQLVVLGTGESQYEDMLRHHAWLNPHKVSANILFDSGLAQRIYAGADMFLMPSVYEPCGLGQLFAMRYGTIPIVRKTGGLADTVQHFDPENGTGNGFLFEDFVASGLIWAIREALYAYNSDDNRWEVLVKNAMSGDYSWDKAANEYIEMYRKIIEG